MRGAHRTRGLAATDRRPDRAESIISGRSATIELSRRRLASEIEANTGAQQCGGGQSEHVVEGFAEVGRAPALIQAAGLDPLEDQAPAYADRLRQAGVEVTFTRYPEAVHAFLSMPGLVPAARPARAEILAHLRSHLLERSGVPAR
ncbi:alpha/beta hydrolase [Nocardia abscessus]|nr:alpha/beta hydrolase [Nocardia abscessus]